MAGTVVDAARVTEAIGEVRDDLDRGRLETLREEIEHQGLASLGQASMPGSVREVTVASRLLKRRDFVNPLDEGFEDGDDVADCWREVARVGDLVTAHGLGEGDDETEKVFAGLRLVEVADVVGGLDSLGGRLEMIGRGDEWDLLRLRNRCEDYGLLGMVVCGQVDSGSADGPVARRRTDFGPCRGRREGGGTAAFAAGCSGGGGGRRRGLGGFEGVLVVERLHVL